VRRMAGNPAQLNARNTKGISCSEKRTDIVPASYILKDEYNGKVVFIRVIFGLHVEWFRKTTL
jgi:hypothetical protein